MGARVHGGDEHRPGGVLRLRAHAHDADKAVLQRLAHRLQRRALILRQLVQKQHAPRTGSSSLCQTVGQLHIVPLWGKYPGVNYPNPGVAVRGYNHPIKKELQKTIQFWGPIFTFSIIAISYRVFNYWSHSEKNILH